jgi:hypothetical protein
MSKLVKKKTEPKVPVTKPKIVIADLTRDKGNITQVGSSSSQLKNIPYLEEVWVSSSMKCCYFTRGKQLKNQNYHFEVGTIKIPSGIQYIADYDTWKPNPAKTTSHILSNILFSINSKKPANGRAFHICENMDDGLESLTVQGCSMLMAPYGDDENPFIVFYYDGEIYFHDMTIITGCFLIPMNLSERTVVYFAIPEDKVTKNHIEILNAIKQRLKEDPDLANHIGNLEAMQYNDKLGIFVVRLIGAGALVQVGGTWQPLAFPYAYDPKKLTRIVE